MADLTPETLAQWREEAGLGVCSDPRREFGRDYRILDLLDALAAEKARARTAWDVHREHVDTMGPIIARHAGDATFEGIRADKGEAALSRVLADVEAKAKQWIEVTTTCASVGNGVPCSSCTSRRQVAAEFLELGAAHRAGEGG